MNLPQCSFTIGTGSFVTEYSHSFWLALATGVLCTLIGMALVMFDCLIPEKLKAAFSVAVDSEEEEEGSCSGRGYLNSANV
ncbi:hypothetical protein CRUP_016646 [Coryphaenoides rupestris]|nr:hypothetical protein CRUP_016646 [Coryphaenoides rupestris]